MIDNKNLTIAKAILELRPGAQFSVIGDSLQANDKGFLECVKWNDDNQDEPKAIDILSQIDIVESRWKNNEYQRLRAVEYPDFTEYLDGVVKGDKAQMQSYIDACLAVKAKYPKGQ